MHARLIHVIAQSINEVDQPLDGCYVLVFCRSIRGDRGTRGCEGFVAEGFAVIGFECIAAVSSLARRRE
jgi:hypothetical protein